MRNRGGAASVVPLCSLPKNLVAWLGLQEVWDVATGQKPFIFRQIGVTIHFGYVGDLVKPQAFRLEWPGVRDWSGAGLTFQTPGAGHPHWRIDIVESLAALSKGAAFGADIIEIVEDFDAEPTVSSIDSLLSSITIESMHLASAARWWISSPSNSSQHMNAPPDPAAALAV